MKRVLLVEDEQLRVDWFAEHRPDHDMTWCVTAASAIEMLEAHIYDALWLDHDLGTEPASGRDVALWLVAHPACNPGIVTIAHTVNTVSGPKIVRDLRAAGRQADWIPFDTLQAGAPA